MESVQFFQTFCFAMAVFLLLLMCGISYSWWVLPNLAYRRLKANGFSGPKPSFPMGNLNEIKKKKSIVSSSSLNISHDIHSVVFPYFARWKKLHGKVFVYWLGTEPFLNIADPEFLNKISADIKGKNWGKPSLFKNDREPMFGSGLVMVEGDDWVRHRRVITPAFSPSNLKAMAGLMVESATKMLDRWNALINSGKPEIDFEKEIINTASEIIAKTSFGISYENGQKVFEKLRELQITLFKSNNYEGVPLSKFMNPKQTLKAKNLGDEVDALVVSIITDRLKLNKGPPQNDLLSLLLRKNDVVGHPGTTLTTRELVDECKTFFFGGHETTALALTWTLLSLSMNPEWQNQLREEIREVIGDGEIDATKVAALKKMGWVMNEVLRLYPPAPNVQRQARQDIKVDNNFIIPNGTNLWIDVVSMHHDQDLWGENVNEFRPERFKDDPLYGGCKHKMGFLPFGFGGRMCVARNLATMEYKIVLTLILTRFSFSISQVYCHSPSILLSLRPARGLPLIFEPL
ncbi:cytokinin hydroxylase-like [Olea europaea var. sylvestris]|uniref:cytokinin hydroxylase-like n=1 Tax=Olea europaea var. sylvestris TaxID=158386 RepID=UPI000C1CF033|nr:cytokinin hydroxylase-like [Olea europaea var. sylvestris]